MLRRTPAVLGALAVLALSACSPDVGPPPTPTAADPCLERATVSLTGSGADQQVIVTYGADDVRGGPLGEDPLAWCSHADLTVVADPGDLALIRYGLRSIEIDGGRCTYVLADGTAGENRCADTPARDDLIETVRADVDRLIRDAPVLDPQDFTISVEGRDGSQPRELAVMGLGSI